MCLGLGDVQRSDQIISVNGFWLSAELQLIQRNFLSENGKCWVKMCQQVERNESSNLGIRKEAALKKK